MKIMNLPESPLAVTGVMFQEWLVNDQLVF